VDLNGFGTYGPAAGFLVLRTPETPAVKGQSDTSSGCLAQFVVNTKYDVFKLWQATLPAPMSTSSGTVIS
jgi:hypothetical protein